MAKSNVSLLDVAWYDRFQLYAHSPSLMGIIFYEELH